MKKIFFIILLLTTKCIAQVNVVGYIQTNGVADYPTHIDSMGKGGYIIAKDTIERNAIPCLRKKYGMACYVQSQQKMYILKDSICANTWVEFSGGTSFSASNGLSIVGNSIKWGGSTISSNVQLDDNTFRSHSIQMGNANTEFFEIDLKAGNIKIEPTTNNNINSDDAEYSRYKILVADTSNGWKLSSIKTNTFDKKYLVAVGTFYIDNNSGTPLPQLTILENTFSNTWSMTWDASAKEFLLSSSVNYTFDNETCVGFSVDGFPHNSYHSDAVGFVFYVHDKQQWAFQILDKNGNPIAPTASLPIYHNISFEIRKYNN